MIFCAASQVWLDSRSAGPIKHLWLPRTDILFDLHEILTAAIFQARNVIAASLVNRKLITSEQFSVFLLLS